MKTKTMLRFLLCFLIISGCYFSVSKAEDPAPPAPTTFTGVTADYFFNAGSGKLNAAKNIVDAQLSPIKHIQGMIMLFGVLAAIIVLIIYAIQWMLAAPARRQELKAGMWPLITGVVLLTLGPRLAISLYEALYDATSGTTAATSVTNAATTVTSVLRATGYVVGAVMILVIAIQWLTSTPNKRQELKGKMINLMIGAIILIAGVTILGFIAKVASDIQVL